MLCLVSGGPDSTCLFHALRELGYRVSALHVNYGLRGERVRARTRASARDELGAEIVAFDARGASEAELRAIRYGAARPTACARPATRPSDQVETILYRLVDEREHEGHQAQARGRRRPPAAAALARGDGGLLPRARAALPHRLVEPRTRSAA